MVEPPNTSKVTEPPEIGPAYRLTARGREEAEDDRLSLLERLLDPVSRRRRDKVRPGWRCLEVGAGRGSMAVWLAEQVGESGKVVATDIDVTYLKRIGLTNLEVHRHNILEDSLDLLGPGSFDLVCSRLTLFWLVGKQELAIHRMAECLRPGGWLVDEDGDWGTLAPVDPTHPHYAAFHGAYLSGGWWASRGFDPAFGRKLPVLFERCGLENIGHEATAEVVRGGSLWARWWQETFEALHKWEKGKGGLTEDREKEYKVLTAPWTDPSFWFVNPLIHACWGQRPAHSSERLRCQ